MNLIYFLVVIYLNTIYCLPQVRVRPQSAVLPSSSEARLICESTDTPFISVAYWTHIGQRIELNPSIVEMHGNELRLFQFGDTAYTQPGAYSCVVSTRYGLLESEPAMLSLPTLDSFVPNKNENNILNLTEGNIAVIPCELPNGNPKPTPIFSLDNNPIVIESNSNRYKILPSGNLHIIDIQPSDAGKYQCAAKNSITGQIVNNSQITTLQVANRPSNDRERQSLFTVHKPPPASRVLVGDNFSIECVIAGWPKPTVEWEKYGDILPEKRSEVKYGTLFLYNIRLEDRGTYICRATSSNGQSDIAYTALVEVLEPPKVIQRPDSLIQVNDGNSVSIKCGFRGRPEPAISWLYNGEEFLMNGSPVTGGVLSLNQPKEGIYQCVGRNAYGIAHASTALVLPDDTDKNEPDILPVKKSLIIFGPNNITVYEGETVQLHCLTQPGSTVQWVHNNEIINLNQMRRYEMLSSGGLRIVSAQKSDSGIYECIASKIGFDTSTAKCFVYVNGLGLNIPVSKLEIVDIKQTENNAIRLSWKINETIENYLSSIQVQYRFIHPKTSWMATDDRYNRSTNYAIIRNLQPSQTFKFRLVGFDMNGKQLVISAAKRITLEPMKTPMNSIVPEITEAWITNDGQISLKWKLNYTGSEMVDGFVIYYRATSSKVNFTTITLPNMRFPPMNTFTISTIQPDQEYELRMATYSSRGASSMSNSIKIFVPTVSTEHHPRVNQMNTFTNLDEVLENITKIQQPPPTRHNIIASSIPPVQKSSDLLYLTIGIISGILLILIIILIAMCILRLLQRKKLIARVKSTNGSAYYCDGLHKPLNPDYATTPCIQHGVVSVDGKLVPFAYPTNPRSPKLYYHRIPVNSTINENGTLRLNSNPMNRLDNENTQENFYHTLTPFNIHNQYEECQSHACSRNHTAPCERSSNSACPIHHHLVNYSSDTLPLKMSSNIESSSQIDEAPFSPTHYHHVTCQRQLKFKGNLASLVNKGLIVDQSAPSSTGSSNSSSGISSSMESPYNHWKYLVPLSVSTTTNNNNNNISSPIIEPIPLTSS